MTKKNEKADEVKFDPNDHAAHGLAKDQPPSLPGVKRTLCACGTLLETPVKDVKK